MRMPSRSIIIAALPLLTAFSCVASRDYVIREDGGAAQTELALENIGAVFKKLPGTEAVEQVECDSPSPCQSYRLRRSNRSGWWDAYVSLASDANGVTKVTISNGTGPMGDIRILKEQLELVFRRSGRPVALIEK
jgi:hypothetical protein